MDSPDVPDGGTRRTRVLRIASALLVGGLIAAGLLKVASERGLRVEPPTPIPGAQVPSLPELPSSDLNLTVVYRGDDLLEGLEASVPVRLGDVETRHEHPSIPGLRYAFEAERDSFELTVSGDTIQLSTVLHYQGRGWYDPAFLPEVTGSCPFRAVTGPAPGPAVPPTSLRPRARVTFTTPLSLEADWSLSTRISVAALEPLSTGERDRCRVTQFQLDLTDWLLTVARMGLEEWTGEVDRQVADLDLRPAIEERWTELHGPFPVADGLWLTLAPEGVRRGRLRLEEGEGAALRLPISLQVRPQLTTEPPGSTEHAPLPLLDGGTVDDGGFRVVGEGRLPYPMLSEFLAAELEGREFTERGRTIRLERVMLRGLGDGRLLLELDVEGDLRGRLFLVGTPRHDPDTNQIRLSDLKVHVATRNLLAQVAAWALRTGLVGDLRERARWPLDDVLTQGTLTVGDALNRQLGPETWLSGEVTAMELIDLVATADALVVRVGLEGSARVEVGDG